MRFLLLMAARKTLVIWIVALSAVLSAGISLILPKTYESQAVIAPPGGSSSLLSGIIGDLPMAGMLGGLAGKSLGGDSQGDYFVTLLTSRRMLLQLAAQFKLREHYKMRRAKAEDLLKAVARKVSAEMDLDTGMIVLSVRDKDPALCHRMAQWLIQRLEELNHELKTRKARNNRLFAEREVRQIRAELDSLERGMTRFQEERRVLEPETQGEAILQGYGEIKAREALKELELRLARQNYGGGHPAVRQAEQELATIRAQLKQSWENGDSDLFLALRDLPAATMDFLRHKRELEIAGKKLVFMLPQLEQAKIDEVNDVPVLEVLDPPARPEKRIKPKRTMMVLAATALSLLASAALVLLLDRLEQDPAFAGHCRELAGRLLPRGKRA
jgi:capsule polysaccharide export protein KpsE/RkpR